MALHNTKKIPYSDIVIGAELGRGAYGRVFKIKYLGVYYAAKEIHGILLEYASQGEGQQIQQNYIREIQICKDLCHPNIVEFYGIFYGPGSKLPLPTMVMELMDNNLTSYLRGQVYVSSTTKIYILHDVSLALYYLHSQNPPIIHRDLSPNNVMIKSYHPQPVAKISDFGTARTTLDKNHDSEEDTKTRAPGTMDFMAPECNSAHTKYGLPVDVFSYGGVALFVINQEWPTPSAVVNFDHTTRKLFASTEVERRQKYMNFRNGPFKRLIEECLSNDPYARPSAGQIEVFLSNFKTNKEEFLVQAIKIGLSPQEDKVDKVTLHDL